MVNEESEPVAPANTGRSSRGALDVIGPAWLRSLLDTKLMLCAKCQKNEATVHLTTILHGRGEETIHLCKDCGADITRLPILGPSKLEALPVSGRSRFCLHVMFTQTDVEISADEIKLRFTDKKS